MSPTLVVVGSGAGIGSSTAALFTAKKFNKVALISRSSTRLQNDRQTILDSLPTARKVEVKTWSVDIAETQKFETVLREIQLFGDVSCVIFNAARVEPSELFDFAEEEIVKDFMVCTLLHRPVGING
jgi:short-subunit dehydrogenase